MPIYEYQCNECGHEFEEMQKITDRPKRKCPACGKLKAKRVISQTTFVLKGSGWYATDYGNRKNSRKESRHRTIDASSSTETKPAEKTDATPKKKQEKKAS